MSRLRNKRICITGGAQGLGKAFGIAFAREGAAVGIVDLNEEGAKRVVAEISDRGGRAVSVIADLSRRDSARGAIDRIAEDLSGLTGLVNNAVWARYLPISAVDEETLERMLAAGLKTAFWSTQAALPWLAKANGASVVNMSSVVALTGVAYASAYSMLKAGLDGMTRAWAVEFGRHNIRVNSIAPSAVPSPMSMSVLSAEGWESRRRSTPLGRLGADSDIANAAVFLMSDESSFLTGDVVRVDGGFSIGTVIPGLDMPARDAEQGLAP
jgi:NAD(P)-dependent dehydrogenase (short-subunit alcohol dehydrogenase family)